MALALAAGRATVVAALLAVITLCWIYVVAMASHGMEGGHAASLFVMWVLMMVAMMLPSALPAILVLDRFKGSASATALFAAGYVLVWVGFSAVAVLAQSGLERAGVLSGGMALASAWIASGVFIAAGAWQFAPVKRTCLDACRSPIAFLSAHWRPGALGALAMGLHHGAFCLGCCWLLMALLFVGGVMNLLWIVPIALFVLIEKCIPGGERMGKLGGALLIAWGAAALFVAA